MMSEPHKNQSPVQINAQLVQIAVYNNLKSLPNQLRVLPT